MRSYGFDEKPCPLVYTLEGKKIGDGAMFVEHVRANYGKVLGMTKETQKKRTHENMQKINEEMRKKEQGLSTSERIFKALDKIKDKNEVSQIQDSFFLPEIEQDCLFWTRRMDLFRENRLLDVPDEVLIAQQKLAEVEAIEAARDQTFEEFKFKYEDHIEGKAANTRTARQSNFGGDDAKSARSKSVKGRSKKVTSQSGANDDDDAKSQKSRKADK